VSVDRVVGVVLAGGAGRRLGGAKPSARLGGRSLVAWVAGALSSVCHEVVVLAKATSPLPSLPAGLEVWREPDSPVHPLAGIAWALSRSAGAPVLCSPVDVPFVSETTLRALLAAPGEVAVADGQPLLGRFGPAALGPLQEAVADGWPARIAVGALAPTVIAVPEQELFNVNTPGDLAAAEAIARSLREGSEA
jgi:molybdopterin-guanine dinucleotide biosynthesis protein A